MHFWKEPLFQFLFLGGVLFAAYSALAPEAEAPLERIVVDAARVRSLEQSFEAAWRRPPTSSERQGLIDDFLAEEVFYREAQKLGLDQDDVVIRRRMRQKMEFLLQEGLALATPPEDALRAFFEEDPQRYSAPGQLTFRQIYLGEGDANNAQAELLLVRLNAPGASENTQDLGQRTMLPKRVASAALSEIDGIFGSGFGEQLLDLPTSRWMGPLQSGFGAHLILLEEIIPSPLVTFEDARTAVMRDFRFDQQRKTTAAVIERLRQQYDILFDEGIN